MERLDVPLVSYLQLIVCQSFNPFPTPFLILGFLQSIMKGLQFDLPDVVHTVLSTLQGRVSKITTCS